MAGISNFRLISDLGAVTCGSIGGTTETKSTEQFRRCPKLW